MADKKTKIQPADIADTTQTGQPPEGATEIPEITAEQIAGMKPEEVMAYVGNAKKFIASATQKSQEAADVKRQNEQLQAESKYWKSQAEQMQGNLQKVVEQMTQPQQTAQSTPSQPPEYDPYNPDKWAREYQVWHNNQLSQVAGQNAELKKTVDSLRDEFNVGLRTINVERYLEKAIPKLGPQVDADEVLLWFNMHPEVQANTETINQAIQERQSIIDQRAEARMEQMIAEKESAIPNVQDADGAPWAGGAISPDDFADKTPAEKEAIVGENIRKSFKALGGGGG
jgi:uncharacterized phage infection (PIP) family protein YhgE